MKVIVELPDDLYQRAKNSAKREDKLLPAFMQEALVQRLDGVLTDSTGRPWLRGFAGLAKYHDENRDLQERHYHEFERLPHRPTLTPLD